MKFVVSGKHIEIGDSLTHHIQEKLEQLVKRYVENALETHITLTKDRHLFHTEISLHVSHNVIVRAKSDDVDPYRSANLAIEKIENRMQRYRNRLRDKRRRDAHADVGLSAAQYIVNTEAEDTGEDTPLIIAETQSEIPQISVSEAVMRLDLSDSSVYLFKNPNNGQLNAIYRRDDGHIGWVNPNA